MSIPEASTTVFGSLLDLVELLVIAVVVGLADLADRVAEVLR